ncbi:hypothetical protein Q31a_40330 [Aureliella helgolandensis]|uniref:Uncharacterized protein n=1 Tax=Aureliella helgolandensis TaxID=2527968 RepID=A0A518GAS2_9BACT|nr:hypothetical protein Q31a_40330 [Aureliella helgolandensis]
MTPGCGALMSVAETAADTRQSFPTSLGESGIDCVGLKRVSSLLVLHLDLNSLVGAGLELPAVFRVDLLHTILAML